MNNLLDRFLDKVQFEPNTGCWIWMGTMYSHDYGSFWFFGSMIPAHRYSYINVIGEVDADLELEHLCRVRCCVNPEHLEAVNHAENAKRGNAGLYNKIKTHCIHGHPFDEENTRISKNGYRDCKQCSVDRTNKWRLKKLK